MGLGCIFFLVAMEEISWGQRLFHWGGGHLFQELNLQGETNVHNFVSPSLLALVLQTIAVLIVVLTLIKPALSLKRRTLPAWTLLLPTATILPIAVLTVLLSFSPIRCSGELIEELLALMAFCYSIQLFVPMARPGSNRRSEVSHPLHEARRERRQDSHRETTDQAERDPPQPYCPCALWRQAACRRAKGVLLGLLNLQGQDCLYRA